MLKNIIRKTKKPVLFKMKLHRLENIDYCLARERLWNENNRKRRTEINKKSDIKNMDRILKWRRANKASAKIRTRKSYDKNRDRILEERKRDFPEIWKKQKTIIESLRLQIFNYYCKGNPRCNCCGESTIRLLTIDHINGGGNKERRIQRRNQKDYYKSIVDRNYPDTYQILCYNCNCGRAINNGVCPHKSEVINILGLSSASSSSSSLTS